MVELNDLNRIWAKINTLEDSKFCQPEEKRVELLTQQLKLFNEMYYKLGDFLCRF